MVRGQTGNDASCFSIWKPRPAPKYMGRGIGFAQSVVGCQLTILSKHVCWRKKNASCKTLCRICIRINPWLTPIIGYRPWLNQADAMISQQTSRWQGNETRYLSHHAWRGWDHGQNKPPKVACIVSGHAARKYISDIFRRTFDDQWDKKIRASEPGKKGKSKNRESKISFRQIMTQTYLSYDRSLTWTTDEDIPYFRKHMWWGISYWRQWIDLDFFTQNIYSITLPSIEKWTCSDSKMKNQRKREKGLFKINFIFHVSELLKFSNHIFA